MPRLSHFRFAALVILIWPVTIFLSGWVNSIVESILWSAMTLSGGTTLSKSVFVVKLQLPLLLAEGFLFGLIPLSKMRAVSAAAVGSIRPNLFSRTEKPSSDMDWTRPMMWAWILPAALFLFRVLSLLAVEKTSVLSSTRQYPDVLSHFFGLPIFTLTSGNVENLWIFDRVMVVMPMLFLIAYPIGVWVRYHFPSPSATGAKQASPTDTLGA